VFLSVTIVFVRVMTRYVRVLVVLVRVQVMAVVDICFVFYLLGSQRELDPEFDEPDVGSFVNDVSIDSRGWCGKCAPSGTVCRGCGRLDYHIGGDGGGVLGHLVDRQELGGDSGALALAADRGV